SFGGVQGLQRDTQYNVGFLFMGRYELGLSGTTRAFWEAGWGIQYVNSLSLDIDLKYNSTPTLGVGLLLPDGEGEWIVEARYLHMSNAGMRLPNQGQNWIQLLVGFKF
ncbi:MAG: acyloxyacyl hydrolase, partial [Armatimonadetes bacterium]|nr:acyloxyacyl hydrolase [Armatimonadota bacterium]